MSEYECKRCDPKACPHVARLEEEVTRLAGILYGGADWQEMVVAERDRYRAALEEGEALDMLTEPRVSHTALLAGVNRFILIAREALADD